MATIKEAKQGSHMVGDAGREVKLSYIKDMYKKGRRVGRTQVGGEKKEEEVTTIQAT